MITTLSKKSGKRLTYILIALGAVVLVALLGLEFLSRSVLLQLTNGRLEGADYWRDEPVILSAGYGFDNIIGLPELTEASVRQAGGSWYGGLKCTNGEAPTTNLLTSSAVADTIDQGYKGYADYDDGLPVVFSWPVATETVDPTDFQFTLNTGEIVFGHAAGMYPNWENNERNTVVLFGDFGNRKKSSEPEARFPVKLEIVADATPLLLIGPGGQEFNAVGLTWTTDKSPYDQGPQLVGAKLNYTGERAVGEGGAFMIERSAFMPNDEFALYDEGDFRLRVLTSGGFSPDGVTGLRPNMVEKFFRLHAKGADGGPGPEPFAGVRYTAPGPADLEPVVVALDDPMRVDRK